MNTFRFLLLASLVSRFSFAFDFRLTTRTKNPLRNANALQDFLSRPIHWPQIVASSNAVESQSMDVQECMRPGQTVDEVFAMGIWSVSWTCRQAQPGRFVVESSDGVPGIATDCSMTFDIRDEQLDFIMSYTPVSPLAYLVTPVLLIDNWMALNVLLPAATDRTPLDSFRKLMGVLYGVAGLAHAADLWLGQSALFTSFGLPQFHDLPVEGQIYSVLWCAVGLLAYILSHLDISSKRICDLGLFIYGFVEIFGAFLSGNNDASTNAIAVQFVVLGAWFYSRQQQTLRQSLD